MKKVSVYKYCLITSLLLTVICGNVYGLQGSTAANGSNAQAVHQLGITGEGIKIGLVSGGNPRADHEAFQGNITNATFPSSWPVTETWHETWVAGIAISRGGVSHPNDIGVAPGASIYSGMVADDKTYIKNALDWMIVDNQCKVIMTVFQKDYDPCNPNDEDYPDGTSQLSLMYDYYADTYNVVFANAAGNYIEDPCTHVIITRNITVFGDAYNGITTAGLGVVEPDNYRIIGSVSNYGPTVDGRNKPDVAGPSNNQTVPTNWGPTAWSSTPSNNDGATSFSTPHTAGVAALLLEYANNTTEPDDGHNEVIKAAIINSTFPNIKNKAGNPTYPADPNNVWHNERGYGRIDALRAFETLSAGRISRSTTVISTAGWAYDTVGNGATHSYVVTGQKNERLVLTVVWNRKIDKHGSNYDVNLPLFNLDVIIMGPSGDTLFSETNNVNNLEKIDLLLPADGNYTVLLENATSKSRDYGLAFEVLPPLTGDFNIDYIVDELDLHQMALDWLTDELDTDIIADGVVNWLDFAGFAENWLKTEPKYYNP